MQAPVEDSDMLDALEVLRLDRDMGKWIIGALGHGLESEITKDRLRQAWDGLQLYGKAKRVVRKHNSEMYSQKGSVARQRVWG